MTTRIIQRNGLWLFTQEERQVQRLRLLWNLTYDEFLNNRSLNLEWPADKSLWGRVQWIRDGLIAHERYINYLDQVIFEWDNDSAQAAQQAYCTAVSVANNFVQVGLGSASAPTCQPVLPPCPYSGVLIELVPGCQGQVTLDILPVQSCCGDPVWGTDSAPESARPPGGLPRQPGTSGDLNDPSRRRDPSAPYDGSTGDKGYSNPGDYLGPENTYCYALRIDGTAISPDGTRYVQAAAGATAGPFPQPQTFSLQIRGEAIQGPAPDRVNTYRYDAVASPSGQVISLGDGAWKPTPTWTYRTRIKC